MTRKRVVGVCSAAAAAVVLLGAFAVRWRSEAYVRVEPETPMPDPRPGQACVSALPKADCDAMAELAMINVRCAFALDGTIVAPGTTGSATAQPDDTCPDSDGISRALKRAHARGTVLMPAGTGSNKYLINAPIRGGYARIRGHRSSGDPTTGTRIGLATGVSLVSSGASLCHDLPAESATEMPYVDPTVCVGRAIIENISELAGGGLGGLTLEDLVIDAQNADYGIYAARVGVSLTNVAVTGADKVGVLLDNVGVGTEMLSVSSGNRDGIMLLDTSSATLRQTTAVSNKRHGVVVSQRAGAPSGHAIDRGTAHFAGGVVQQNGTKTAPAQGHGVYVLFTKANVTVENLKVHDNAMDGIRVANAHNVFLNYNYVQSTSIGQFASMPAESINHAIAVAHSRHCVVESNMIGANQVPNPPPSSHRNVEDIWVTSLPGQAAGYVYVTRNMFWSPATGPLDNLGGGNFFEVKFVTTSATAPFEPTSVLAGSQHQVSNFHADSVPLPGQGRWRKGDVVWNRSPSPGEAAGWICENTNGINSFECIAWRPMPALQ